MSEDLAKIEKNLHGRHEVLLNEAQQLLVGKKVRVMSNYNGQPYGRSRPSLQGKVFTIADIFFDAWGLTLGLEGQQLCIPADEVELFTGDNHE